MKKIIFLYAFLFFAVSAVAQTAKLTAFKNKVTNGYHFWLYEPCQDTLSNSGKPLVLFLHGASLCGNDLNRVRRYGCLNAIDMGKKIDAFILAPQNPGGAWNPDKIQNILTWVLDSYSRIDTNRVYVIGMSLGGYGTMDFVGTYPEKIAAAMAFCGGCTLRSYEKLSQLPLYIIHGTGDKAVPVSQSRKVRDALVKCCDTNLLVYSEFAGASHGRLARMFYLNETYQWLFSHSLSDTIRQVNRSLSLTNAMLDGVYKDLDKTNSKYELILNGASPSTANTDSLNVITKDESDTIVATEDIKPQVEQTNDNTLKNNQNQYYTVRKGDTLYAIAKRNGTTVSKLCSLNHITENTILQIGQKLKIK